MFNLSGGNYMKCYKSFMLTIVLIVASLNGMNHQTKQCYKGIVSNELPKVVSSIKKGADVNYTCSAEHKDLSNLNFLQIALIHYNQDRENEGIIEQLLQSSSIKINNYCEETPPPFILAIRTGNLKIVDFFICKSDLDPNIYHANLTPLHFVLSNISQHNCIDICKKLLALDTIDTNMKDILGQTALHLACEKKIASIVALILAKKKTDINIQDHEYNTPFHIACGTNSQKIIQLFLQKKELNISLKNRNGETCADVAYKNRHTDIVKLIVQSKPEIAQIHNGYGETLLYNATSAGDEETIKLLLPISDINAVNNKNDTPLIVATIRNYKKIVSLLLAEKNLDICQSDNYGNTALHCACTLGHKAITQQLLDESHGRNNCKNLINIQNNHGENPLHMACKAEKKACVRSLLLFKHKISPQDHFNYLNAKDYLGNTALHYACSKLNPVIIKALVHNGAQTTIKNNEQATPLFLIYSFMGDPNSRAYKKMIYDKDSDGNTQLHLSSTLQITDNTPYLQWLIKQGIDIHVKNNNGETALDLVHKMHEESYKHYMNRKIKPRLKELIRQNHLLHDFLRVTSVHTECALFKAMLQNTNRFGNILPSEIITKIMLFYYTLNIETIMAKRYLPMPHHENYFIENRQAMKKKLSNDITNFPLLWRRQLPLTHR